MPAVIESSTVEWHRAQVMEAEPQCLLRGQAGADVEVLGAEDGLVEPELAAPEVLAAEGCRSGT